MDQGHFHLHLPLKTCSLYCTPSTGEVPGRTLPLTVRAVLGDRTGTFSARSAGITSSSHTSAARCSRGPQAVLAHALAERRTRMSQAGWTDRLAPSPHPVLRGEQSTAHLPYRRMRAPTGADVEGTPLVVSPVLCGFGGSCDGSSPWQCNGSGKRFLAALGRGWKRSKDQTSEPLGQHGRWGTLTLGSWRQRG